MVDFKAGMFPYLRMHWDIFAPIALLSQLAIHNGKLCVVLIMIWVVSQLFWKISIQTYKLNVQIGFKVKNEPKGSAGKVVSLEQLDSLNSNSNILVFWKIQKNESGLFSPLPLALAF